jgi:hypothetical protein
MAAGPTVIGAGAFVAIKFAGYTLAGRQLNRSHGAERGSPWIFGLARTCLGVAAGVTYAIYAERIAISHSDVGFFLWLLPVRVAEWLLILFLFFERHDLHIPRLLKNTGLGTAWSYLLDAPAFLAAWFIPGGFWVC